MEHLATFRSCGRAAKGPNHEGLGHPDAVARPVAERVLDGPRALVRGMGDFFQELVADDAPSKPICLWHEHRAPVHSGEGDARGPTGAVLFYFNDTATTE